MIRSMTGYGHAEVAGVRLSLSVECKSLNHRHLDIALRLPRGLSALELDARRVIQGAVQRGRVEVSVGVAPIDGAPTADLTINMAQARAYIEMARRAGDELNLGGIPTLQWMLEQPGVITREEQAPLSPDEWWPLLHDGLAKALGELRARRDTEGAALDKELRALLAAMAEQVGVMSSRGPAATERKQQRLRERIQALLAGRGKPSVGVRVGVRARGCSGLSYTIEYADEKGKFDEIVEDKGVTILVDPKAVMFILGTEMDYVEEKLQTGFVFRNPNEKGRCGCGESFHV